MRIDPEISGASIVLLGNFNPAIFTPAWFALHGILPKSVADNAELQVAHPQILSFSTERLNLEVTPDRFLAGTQSAPNIQVQDLVMRVFGEHLPHTPIRAVGINRDVHFRAASPAARDRVGKVLAPTAPWGKIGEKLQLDGDQGGMLSLTMQQSRPAGRPPDDQINVTVEPSVRIDDRRLGIYVRVNDHYALDESAAGGPAERLGFLADGFDLSIKRADEIVDHVMSLATDSQERHL